MMQTDRQVAIHEAAHVVIAAKLGVPFGDVDIVRTDEQLGQGCSLVASIILISPVV